MALFSAPTLPEIAPEALERALSRLNQRLASKFITGVEATQAYRSDDSRIEGLSPAAVVFAESRADIEETLRIALETAVPVTPRSGGSGRTGGAVPVQGGIVLVTEKMNRILDIDVKEGLAVVEPGVRLSDLHAAVEAEGWFYPPDPNSSHLCCLAGNLGENAAGPRAFKYGATRDHVLGFDAILPGGTNLFVGRRTRKGVTGYDLAALLIGSEGTLAAFGNITLKLLPKPEAIITLLGLFPSMATASRAVEAIIAARLLPRCIEFLDPKTLEVMRMAGNALRADAAAMLLIEVDGSESDCERQAELLGNLLDGENALEVLAATSESARKKLWEARKSMSYAVRTRAKNKISEDVVVPRRQLATLLDEVVRLGERHNIDALSYGHAGDGNLHVNFLWNEDDELPRVEAAVTDLFQTTVLLGGTLSGEHGIGILKAPFLPLEQSEEQIALQKRLKAAFDPKNVMNPGKIFPERGHGSC